MSARAAPRPVALGGALLLHGALLLPFVLAWDSGSQRLASVPSTTRPMTLEIAASSGPVGNAGTPELPLAAVPPAAASPGEPPLVAATAPEPPVAVAELPPEIHPIQPPAALAAEAPPPEPLAADVPDALAALPEPPPPPSPAPPEPPRMAARPAPLSRPAPPVARPGFLASPAAMPVPAGPPAGEPERPAIATAAAHPGPAMTELPAAFRRALVQHLRAVQRYPVLSQERGEHGVALVRFELSRQGAVLAARLERSTGHPALDREALALLGRAPLPSLPGAWPHQSAAFVVPITFELR